VARSQSESRKARRAAAARAQAQQSEQVEAPRALQAVPAPEPEPVPQSEADDEGLLRLAMELNFLLPPGDLLYAEGAIPHSPPKTIKLGPALEAHWQKFVIGNPDLKVLSKTVRALMRVLIREHEASMESAREEMRRTGVPARPKAGPLLEAVRAERRLMNAEDSGDIFDD